MSKPKASARIEHTSAWNYCKVAFGVGDGRAVWDKLEKPLWKNRLPNGWTPNEADCSGCRWVLIFRVDGMPTEADGRAVRRLLSSMEPRVRA